MSNIHPLRGGEGEGGEEESVPNYVHKLCYVVDRSGSHTEAIDLFERDGGAPMITEGGWNSFLEHSL